MKKRLFLFIAVVLFVVACIKEPPAKAAPDTSWLPFELTAPEHVSIFWLEGNDALSSCSLAWSKNDSMSAWLTKMEDPETHDAAVAEFESHGYSDLWITPQMDWSIDNQTDWHYNKYWDTDGYDEDYVQHLGDWAYTSFLTYSQKTDEAWVFRYMGNIDDPSDTLWYGDHENADYDGWKDVLSKDCYTIVKTDDESTAKFDYENHTIYVRMRFLVTIRTDEEDIKRASEWSEIAAVGKEAKGYEPVKPGDLPAPQISDLRMTDEEFNGFPVIAFQIKVPNELIQKDTELRADYAHGGDIIIEVEARVQDKGEWVVLQGDWILTSGELKYKLLTLAQQEGKVDKGTPIELRARYCCRQSELDDVWSDYSEIITFGSKEMEVVTQPTPAPEASEDEENTHVSEVTQEKNKCWLCGFCPCPLGLCIFIWLLILIVIIVVVIIILKKVQKKDKKEDKKEN